LIGATAFAARKAARSLPTVADLQAAGENPNKGRLFGSADQSPHPHSCERRGRGGVCQRRSSDSWSGRWPRSREKAQGLEDMTVRQGLSLRAGNEEQDQSGDDQNPCDDAQSGVTP
jgi:hypothetical protein